MLVAGIESPRQIILNQLKGPLVFILLLAGALSFAVGEWFDASVILFAVLVNTVLGFFQEYKASRALEELRSLVKPFARVERDGNVKTISTDQIVIGDVLVLETGDVITADARLTQVWDLQTNESTLTGESTPVVKTLMEVSADAVIGDRTDMVWSGTTVMAGRARGVVVAVGKDTELGKIAELVRETRESPTPLQAQMTKFSRELAMLTFAVCLVVVGVGLARGFEIVEIVRLSAAIAVAAVPEGLLIGVTVVLVVGMRRILKAKALVRRLVAAETLGSVSVICTDKTGTITEGSMKVVKVGIGESGNLEDMLLIAALCNNVYFEGDLLHGTPTESALMRYAIDEGFSKHKLELDHARLAEIPFSSATKYMATLHNWEGKRRVLVKGAPEVIFSKCARTVRSEEIEVLTRQGLRLLAVAYKDIDGSQMDFKEEHLEALTYPGFFAIADPIRAEAKETIKQAKLAGVRTVIITGDHPETARYIAHEAGFDGDSVAVMTGVQLDALSDEAFSNEVQTIDVYARVTPAHKVRIVNAWKSRGASVAMTGDGVNDGPALKAADVGIALGSGTEVAKQTSDLVLLDNNLATLVAAIKQGRILFDNIRKIVVYLLSDSSSELLLIVIALAFGLPLPILPAQLLWINLVTDGFPHIALTFEPGEKNIMTELPRSRAEPLLNREMKELIILIGIITNIGLFAIYGYLLATGAPIELVRTFIFAALGIVSLLYVFSIRSLRTTIFHVNPFQNWVLIGAVLIGFLFLLAPIVLPAFRSLFGFVELSLREWGVLVMIGVIEILLIECFKYAIARHRLPAT